MAIDEIVSIVHGRTPWPDTKEDAKAQLFDSLFGSPTGRYPANAGPSVTLRAPLMPTDGNVPYAAYIHPSNPSSGPYGGMSIGIFPVAEGPCLLTFVVGTNGLSPDEQVLGRPGHARKMKAVCSWLNKKHGGGKRVAWAKYDPVRTDIGMPDALVKELPTYKAVFDKYGDVLYAIYVPTGNEDATREATLAFLDLMFDERGFQPMAAGQGECNRLRGEWLGHLMPDLMPRNVQDLLQSRRYAIIQGPPGTGKTRMAQEILRNAYAANGTSVQFHPNTTYENFIGGLAPVTSESGMGFQFSPQRGFLMEAAAAALRTPDRPYLLHIDEINRADLSKVLGEGIYLLEADDADGRAIDLPHDFQAPFGRRLTLPKNLHVLGTMNSTDRSLAIVDVAVRRRFAFAKLWPQSPVVREHGGKLMITAFDKLVTIFVEHAGDDAFDLMPGHSYFLEKNDERAKERLNVTLVPLLEEYLRQGYVGGFAEEIRAYLQWIDSL